MLDEPTDRWGAWVKAAIITRQLGVPRHQVHAFARLGQMPCRRDGYGVRYRLSDVSRWLRENPSLEDAAALAGLVVPDAEDLVKAGMLPCTTAGGRRFVPASALDEWRGYARRCERLRVAGWRTGNALGFVYFLEATAVGLVKIGWSTRADARRLADLDAGSPVALQLLAVKPGGAKEEATLHDRFALGRRRGEWFDRRTPGLSKEIASCSRQFGRPLGLSLPKNFLASGVELASGEEEKC